MFGGGGVGDQCISSGHASEELHSRPSGWMTREKEVLEKGNEEL